MLTIKNLTKMYDQNVIFKNLNLTVQEGEVLSIVGPSGIGKTTLIKIMAGLEPANSGEITINNEAISIDGERSDANIGLIFQDFNLFPNFKVMDNITLAPANVNKVPAEKAKEQALSLLESLGMVDKADLYPYQLSGGQKQRVEIARA